MLNVENRHLSDPNKMLKYSNHCRRDDQLVSNFIFDFEETKSNGRRHETRCARIFFSPVSIHRNDQISAWILNDRRMLERTIRLPFHYQTWIDIDPLVRPILIPTTTSALFNLKLFFQRHFIEFFQFNMKLILIIAYIRYTRFRIIFIDFLRILAKPCGKNG